MSKKIGSVFYYQSSPDGQFDSEVVKLFGSLPCVEEDGGLSPGTSAEGFLHSCQQYQMRDQRRNGHRDWITFSLLEVIPLSLMEIPEDSI